MSEADWPTARPVHPQLRGVMRRLGERKMVLAIQADSAEAEGDPRRAASLRARAAKADARAHIIAGEHARIIGLAGPDGGEAFARGILAGAPAHIAAEAVERHRRALGTGASPQYALLWPAPVAAQHHVELRTQPPCLRGGCDE